MKASKLFHAVVVLGMSIAAESACSSDDPEPTPNADAGEKTDAVQANDAGTKEDKDAFAGWSMCG